MDLGLGGRPTIVLAVSKGLPGRAVAEHLARRTALGLQKAPARMRSFGSREVVWLPVDVGET